MSDTVLAAVCTGVFVVISNLIVAVVQSSKTKYRIEQLEKKVEKHNNLVVRMYACEDRLNIHDEKLTVANHRIEDLEQVR